MHQHFIATNWLCTPPPWELEGGLFNYNKPQQYTTIIKYVDSRINSNSRIISWLSRTLDWTLPLLHWEMGTLGERFAHGCGIPAFLTFGEVLFRGGWILHQTRWRKVSEVKYWCMQKRCDGNAASVILSQVTDSLKGVRPRTTLHTRILP